MIKQKLTKEIMNDLSASNIVYAEYAESGAMGNVGGIILYSFKNNELIRFETNLFKDEDLYVEARDFLLQHKKDYFNYFYGGMGNHVFINKKVRLRINDGYFTFKAGSKIYKIYPTVRGVFNEVVHVMRNGK
jgi:hypothetical protein